MYMSIPRRIIFYLFFIFFFIFSFYFLRKGLFVPADNFFDSIGFKVRGKLPCDKRIVIFAIDNQSILKLTRIFPKIKYFTKLLKLINKFNPQVVGFDMLIAEELPEQFRKYLMEFADEVARQKVVIGAKIERYEKKILIKQRLINLKGFKLIKPAKKIERTSILGLIKLLKDPDSVVRKARLRYFYKLKKGKKIYLPSFALAVYAASLGVDDELKTLNWKTNFIPEEIEIDYRGDVYPVYSVESIFSIRETKLKKIIENKIILIGPTYIESHDRYMTPISFTPLNGVVIHANILDCILNKRYIRRVNFFPFTVVSVLFLSLLVYLISVGSLKKDVFFATVFILISTLLYFYLFITYKVFINIGFLWIQIFLIYIIGTSFKLFFEEKEKKILRRLFSEFVSDKVVEEILNSKHIALKGERREAAVLFTDIRGFTGITAAVSPEDLINLMNEYFDRVSRIIMDNKGIVDKYIGDAVMGVFGVPKAFGNTAENAAKAAVEILGAVREISEKYRKVLNREFKVGIGIAYGEVIAGVVGSSQHREYTVLGEIVNIAARIEGLTKKTDADIIVNEELYRLLKDSFKMELILEKHIKGYKDKFNFYKIKIG